MSRCLPLLLRSVCYILSAPVLGAILCLPARAQGFAALPPISSVAPPPTGNPSALRVTPQGETVVPMMFPVLGKCRWSDTWGAPRDGGRRKHQGQDLPAPKMRPLLAAFDGVWWGSGIESDNGCFVSYLHINNDTPGTDDGKGGEEYATAPGIWQGVRVVAGQHVAYCGDSGNAEDTISHLHFELSIPNTGTINAAASLRGAQKVTKPRYRLEKTDFRPAKGQLRIDGQIVTVRVAAWNNVAGKVSPQTSPMRRRVTLPVSALADADANDYGEPIGNGDFVAIIGKDPAKNGEFVGERMVLLRANETRSGTHRRKLPEYHTDPPSDTPRGFVPHPPASPEPPPLSRFTFENGWRGWTITGDAFGRDVERGDYGRGRFSGWEGGYYLSSAHGVGTNIDRGRGKAVSPSFVLNGSRLRFLIGGGDYPDTCVLRLIVDGKPVLSATGNNSDRLQPVEWDISAYRGKSAIVEIVDERSVAPRGYLLVDGIEVLP